MNYYPHHLGDYAAATTHLSWDEDMAYTRLLRAYYTAEKGIPDATKYRVSRATSRSQRQAVDVVLQEFFTLRDGVWTQRRADEEIAAYQDKQEKAKRSAKARWSGKRPKSERNANASADAMRTHSEGNAPNPNNQNQDQKLVLPTPTPDSSPRYAREGAASGGGSIEAAVEANPALPAVVRLRKRGEQWLRLTPDNPEIIAAIGEGVTVESIEAFAEAYPDKPPLYVIRAARREHGEAPQPIRPGANHVSQTRKPSAVERVEAAIHERRRQTAAEPGIAGLPMGEDGREIRQPLDVASG